MVDRPPNELSAARLAAAYRSGELSPVDVAEAALERLEATAGTLNAFALVDRETTLARAREAEARHRQRAPLGLLDGVPVAVKDVFLTAGWPTLKGSRTTDPEQPWEVDAPSVAALQRHGYVPIGKTTTPEMGWKGVTDSALHGVTRNPWNPETTAGGSSGGSAAAIAAGIAPIGLGTDAGGSIRIPAAFCGVAGLKPTSGEVPHWPTPPYGTLAHAGPLGWTVADVALAMNVLREDDPRDPYAGRRIRIDYARGLEGGVQGLRVALSQDLGFAKMDPEIAGLVARAATTFEELGARVERVGPGFEDPEAAFALLFYVGAHNAVRALDERQRALLEPELDAVAREYAAVSIDAWLDATAQRNALTAAMNAFHERYDLLLTPTLPIPAFTAGREVPEGWPHARWPVQPHRPTRAIRALRFHERGAAGGPADRWAAFRGRARAARGARLRAGAAMGGDAPYRHHRADRGHPVIADRGHPTIS